MDIKKAKLLILGKSGSQYNLQSFPIDSKLTTKGGIYIFLNCQFPSARKLIFGDYSDNIAKTCFALRDDMISKNATHIAILLVKSKEEALHILDDIKYNW